MQPKILIIQRPDIDFSAYLGIALEVLGRSPVSAADSSPQQLSTASRFLSCLSAMRNSEAGVGLNPKFLSHVMFSVLIVADELDILDMMECAGGMPFVIAETTVRGVLMVVMSGNLAQWKLAVVAGATSEMSLRVRYAFNQIQIQFRSDGINLWTDYRQRSSTDQTTFLLEDKRVR